MVFAKYLAPTFHRTVMMYRNSKSAKSSLTKGTAFSILANATFIDGKMVWNPIQGKITVRNFSFAKCKTKYYGL